MSTSRVPHRRVALLLGAGVLLFAMALLHQGSDWSAWRPATCLPDGCFCEAVRAGTIRQPANTFSSFGYAVAGLLVVAALPATRRAAIGAPWLGYPFALSALTIGLGSALYHASLTFWGQFLDVAGMYLAVTFMLLYAWMRHYRLSTSTVIILFLAMNVLLDTLLLTVPETRRWLFAVVLLAALIAEAAYLRALRPAIHRAWLMRGLALFAIAYTLWIADSQRWLCWPQSLVQGHALWHLGGAAALWMLFRYYRSERPADR